MKLNMDRLMNLMIENDNNYFAYQKSAAEYKKEHGYIPTLSDSTSDREIQMIVWSYNLFKESDNAVSSFLELMSFDKDEIARLYAAKNAVKRWYEKETEWQRCIPMDLLERIEKFVIG